MPDSTRVDARAKFTDPHRTADGSPRAWVPVHRLETLWINTGTLCNLECRNCYIESSPTNDALVYITAAEVREYFDEIARAGLEVETVGFTGGESFMNPDFMEMVEDALRAGFKVLILTNAMRPMMKQAEGLLALRTRYGARLQVRVSLDHYTEELHAVERGPRSWSVTLAGLKWLSDEGFRPAVAGRTCWEEDEAEARRGYARLFAEQGVDCDASDPASLFLFPEMMPEADTPEITTSCWKILGKSPRDAMCASSRMVVKRRGEEHPTVVACTLLPYDSRFDFGRRLEGALDPVPLNHVHCSKFCVLGSGSCS